MAHTPIHHSLTERIVLIVLSLGLIGYGLAGLLEDDIYLPGRRGGNHFHGLPAWLLFTAMLSAAIVLLSAVVDHYDKRDNERHYRSFIRWGGRFCVACFFAGLALDLGVKFSSLSGPISRLIEQFAK